MQIHTQLVVYVKEDLIKILTQIFLSIRNTEGALRTEKKISTTVCYVNYIHVPWIKQGSFI